MQRNVNDHQRRCPIKRHRARQIGVFIDRQAEAERLTHLKPQPLRGCRTSLNLSFLIYKMGVGSLLNRVAVRSDSGNRCERPGGGALAGHLLGPLGSHSGSLFSSPFFSLPTSSWVPPLSSAFGPSPLTISFIPPHALLLSLLPPSSFYQPPPPLPLSPPASPGRSNT